ncbi:MAG: bifunctional precorrin-2 dehydrogenase/sirohydrochlorin ferrochelatase [Tannerellaceae bacterium]|nr:bifunctional precorrin-2 dehydrogenase/sirohydrochlorin ferrochelatase [Tannerellaceae bacterium]
MNFLPVNISIRNKKILIIGGGKVAFHKATILARFTGEITILAPAWRKDFREWEFTFIRKTYEKKDLQNYHLIYVCTDNRELNQQIKQDANEAGILASVCDAPELCDFTSPAICRKENLTISVATDGKEVKRAIAIRNRIQELIDNGVLNINI